MNALTNFQQTYQQINLPLKFEPKFHTYHYDGKKLISVTTFVKKFFKDFDSNYWAYRKAEETGKTVEEIKAGWTQKKDVSIQRGIKAHLLAENYANGLIQKSTEPFMKSIRSFFEDHAELTMFKTELQICYPEKGLAGTIDLLMQDKEGNVYMFDWKTNEQLDFTSNFAKGLTPIEHLPDRNFIHYSLQLSMYKHILKQKYNLDIQTISLIHIGESFYTVYKAEDMSKEVEALIHYENKTTQ